MLLKNLIKDIPADKKIFLFLDLSTNSKDVKKNIFFLLLKEIRIMVKNLLKSAIKKVLQ